MLTLQLRAVAQCEHESDGRGCVFTQEYKTDAESMSVDKFAVEALEYFEAQGWQFFGGARCPQCKVEQKCGASA